MHSAFVEDLELVGCFLDFQYTKESPMKMQYPVVDLVSRHEAQSESTKPLTCNSTVEEKKISFPGSSSSIVKCFVLHSSEAFLVLPYTRKSIGV